MAAILVGGATAPSPYPPGTVLLMVAPWCVPCHAEIAKVESLAVAARPHALRVMTMEDGPRARAMVRRVPSALRWDPSPDRMQTARADLADRSAGLPYSVATDGDGRICADQRGGLDEARVRAMIARCAQ